jgi:hypothetical protein
VLATNQKDTTALYHVGLIYAGWKDIDAAKQSVSTLKEVAPEMAAQLTHEIARRAF